MSSILSFSMYILSFTPLWITVLFLDIKSLIEGGENKWTEIISISLILIVTLLAINCLFTKFSRLNNDTIENYELSKANESKTITSEFLLSYIMPLFAFDFTQWDGVFEFLIFFVILGYLSIKHNYFSVNIFLELAGYKMYECILVNRDGIDIEKTVISKQSLTVFSGNEIEVKTINNEILLDVKNKMPK